jgi:hypothetical protein
MERPAVHRDRTAQLKHFGVIDVKERKVFSVMDSVTVFGRDRAFLSHFPLHH